MSEPDGYISIKNWSSFQHYKDRTPPWIKLYNELLDRYHFMQLTSAQKWHLMGLWLMASKHDNKIPNDLDWIKQEIGATEKVRLDPIMRWIELGHDDSAC